MSKKDLIDSLFVVLCLYEDALNVEKTVTKQDYLTYVQRKYTFFDGRGNEEIACLLKGIYKAQFNITHDELHSIVFHMISLINKEE